MIVLRILPLVLSSLLLGAHFYRAGMLLLVVLSLAAPLVLLIPRWWAAPALQVALFVGAAEWVRTALSIAAVREMTGAPVGRMLLILGGVALFTALAAFPLSGVPERRAR